METILLLHGAIGSKDQLQKLAEVLKSFYQVHLVNFHGHGGSPVPDTAFSIPFFTDQLLSYMEVHRLSKAHIFGYSLGGYVGMYLARHYPEKVNKLVCLATKFYWDEKVAEKEIPLLNAGLIETKLPEFAAALQKRHAPQDWKIILEKTKSMLLDLGKHNPLHLTDYTAIESPCLLLLGDRDKMITLEETMQVYHQLPYAQMGILPATAHQIEQADVELLSFMIKKFVLN